MKPKPEALQRCSWERTRSQPGLAGGQRLVVVGRAVIRCLALGGWGRRRRLGAGLGRRRHKLHSIVQQARAPGCHRLGRRRCCGVCSRWRGSRLGGVRLACCCSGLGDGLRGVRCQRLVVLAVAVTDDLRQSRRKKLQLLAATSGTGGGRHVSACGRRMYFCNCHQTSRE